MQSIAECKTFFIRINHGSSEAAAQGLAVGARRARKMARPKPASEEATLIIDRDSGLQF
jgi:hypothetical protein